MRVSSVARDGFHETSSWTWILHDIRTDVGCMAVTRVPHPGCIQYPALSSGSRRYLRQVARPARHPQLPCSAPHCQHGYNPLLTVSLIILILRIHIQSVTFRKAASGFLSMVSSLLPSLQPGGTFPAWVVSGTRHQTACGSGHWPIVHATVGRPSV